MLLNASLIHLHCTLTVNNFYNGGGEIYKYRNDLPLSSLMLNVITDIAVMLKYEFEKCRNTLELREHVTGS